jgi:integrase
LGKLFATVRAEFRHDVLVFDAADPVFGGRPCQVNGCARTQRSRTMCNVHHQQWLRAGRPELGEFLRTSLAEPDDRPAPYESRLELHRLGRQLKLEVQYALQRRRDEGQIKTRPGTVRRVVNILAGAGAASVLELSEQQWAARFPGRCAGEVLLRYARRQVEDLWRGTGWEAEYQRDLWRLRDLGTPGHRGRIRFDRIPQQWLKDLAKRWLRWQVSTAGSSDTAFRGAAAITRFGQFLAHPQVGVDQLANIDRGLLERYLADLHHALAGRTAHKQHIGSLNAFFRAIRRHGWDDSLPPSAMFFPDDYPKRTHEQLPRALAEHIMAQVEDPGNLDRWDDPARRLITVILIRCGLRISDAGKLPYDCVVTDPDGAPYLKYFNHKMKREALVPIDEELTAMIAQQQQRVRQRWPNGTPVLFPRLTTNPDGSRPYSGATYRSALYRWLKHCNVSDEHGRPAHLTPHQWRHTLGTRLINRDVPQEVVRRILDHDSAEMTAHYARLHDTTVRRHWEAARKVNINGEVVTFDPNGPLAEATWAKQRLSRATQALPNGYCGLPVVQSCPHANSCLTCPMFLTTAEFLPQHRQQHQRTLQIIATAETRSQARMVEMNRQLADNLGKIITGLEADDKQVADAC